MQSACERFGHPESSFRVVHVAGTNGKGTVSAFVASMLRASGKKVGLYTSPHLCRFAERIQIEGEPLDDARLAAVLNRVMDEVPDATFFEVATRFSKWDWAAGSMPPTSCHLQKSPRSPVWPSTT